MSRHQVSPSPFLSSSRTTQLHYTNSYTYSHPNLNFLQYTIQILVPHVMWSAQAVREFRPHSTSSICLARNPKHVIVQWVGIGTHISDLLLPYTQCSKMRTGFQRCLISLTCSTLEKLYMGLKRTLRVIILYLINVKCEHHSSHGTHLADSRVSPNRYVYSPCHWDENLFHR